MIDERIKNLLNENIDYEIIKQDKPINSMHDAIDIFTIEKSAPTLVLKVDGKLIGCIVSFQNGKVDFKRLKNLFGYNKIAMASPHEIKEKTGYEIGSIPLIGLGIPILFDSKLLKHDYVFGGTGNPYFTLKIAPSDLLKINNIIGTFE